MAIKVLFKNILFKIRIFLEIYFLVLEKFKIFLKWLFRLSGFLLQKTVNIKYLIKKGDVLSKLTFSGEIYTLKQKKDINNKKFKYLPEGKYKIPDHNIFIVKNGIVDAGTNSIFSSDGKRITGINFQELPFDYKVIYGFKKINIEYLEGALLVLGVGTIEKNYSHAWTEFAARAYSTKISKINYDYILIDHDTKFVREILKLINLPIDKIIFSKNYQFIKAKILIYPELINNFKLYFLNGINVYHRKYLPSWLKLLYREVSSKVNSSDLIHSFEKIYISRRNKSERIILNEDELMISLQNLDFRTIYFEDYSVHDQIYIMKSSKQIVAIHGAGLVNINFCNKGTKVLELFPFFYQCAFFYMHASMCSLEYDFYIGKPVNKLWKRSPIMENFYVEVDKIEKFIKEKWN